MTKIFLYIFLILFTLPVFSISAEMRTLEIGVSFNPSDDPLKQHRGYRLFQDGAQVCDETVDSETSSIVCNFLSENGTFNFTLKAYYSDNTESPSSPPFPFTLASTAPTSETNTEPPVARLLRWPLSGETPLTVSFDGSSSTAPNSSIVDYIWTFDDSSPTVSGNATTSHVFTEPGTYYARLTVENSEGLTDTVTKTIVVSADTSSNEETPPITTPSETTEQTEMERTYAQRFATAMIISRFLTAEDRETDEVQ